MQSTASQKTPRLKPHLWRPSALLINKDTIFGGKSLGFKSPITTTVHVHKEFTKTSWTGFTIEVPYGPKAEDEGFGRCHGVSRSDGRDVIVPLETYKVTVQFPNTANYFIEELTPDLISLVPNADKRMSRLDVFIPPGSGCFVKGYGMPFSHPGEQFEAFITQNALDNSGMTLVDVLQLREFSFMVAYPSIALDNHWTQPFPPLPRYPYGEEHFWSVERYNDILPKTKGPQFPPAWTFDNDNEHLAALSHSQAQDVMWIHNAAIEIGKIHFRAYFITSGCEDLQDCRCLTVIVPLGKDFLAQYEQPWRHLVDSGFLNLHLFDNEDDESPAEWEARIEEAFHVDVHPVDINDLVLRVRRPSPTSGKRPDFEVKAFRSRTDANVALRESQDSWTCVSIVFNDLLHDYARKVDAVNEFRPEAQPTNLVACGVSKTVAERAKVDRPKISEDIKFMMDLHRALVRGNGFYQILVPKKDDRNMDKVTEAMAKAQLEDNDEPRSEPPRSLPVVNLVKFNQEKITALLLEALPADRLRLWNHLVNVALGFVLVTAPPGFGKTTLAAIVTLLMQGSLGKIFGTAPTNVATDNFAERLDLMSQKATLRINERRPSDQTRTRRTLVVRAFKFSHEYQAFINLLRDPKLGNQAAPNQDWGGVGSKWTLKLSLAFWLLVALRSPAVRDLHEDDHEGIYAVHRRLDRSAKCPRLRAVATGEMSWQEYEGNGTMVAENVIRDMFYTILNHADILCTTPALACQDEFKQWREERAKGIAVDEAGNICRPDLYSVWGNTMLPCLLVGDDKQFPPDVMSLNEKDRDGNYFNRLGRDGKISALEFFRASGWPVFRLRTQLRMATGLFDTCHREVYNDLPFSYGSGSILANHVVGQALEGYLTRRFWTLRPSPAGSIREVFVHCPGTTCIVDEATKSKRNPGQVENTLEFLSDLVKRTPGVSASSITIISPYKANVVLVERRRKDPKYSVLFAMPPAATVDSFQGREADIIAVIIGTTQEVGPGFTTDENRLNVMLSRQKSGLLIFGDVEVLGPMKEDRGRSGRGGGRSGVAVIVGEDGKQHFVQKGMLFSVLRNWHSQGRVVTLPARGA